MSEKLEFLIMQQKSDRNLLEENLQRELRSIRNRQEMIFQKQDQIQSTLHGETLPIQSPPASAISFSPPFMSSAPSSVTGCRMASKQSQQPQPQQLQHEPLEFDTSDVVSMLTDSDMASLLSYDWTALDQAEQLNSTAPTEVFGVGIQTPQHSIYDYSEASHHAVHDGTIADTPIIWLEDRSTRNITDRPVNRDSAGNVTDRPVNRNSSAGNNTDDIQNPNSSVAGINVAESVDDGNVKNVNRGSAAAGNFTALKHPSDVLNVNRKYEQRDIGKLGRLLAREAFFGDNILRQSTICGDKKRGLMKLDPVKMSLLLGTLHRHPSFCTL